MKLIDKRLLLRYILINITISSFLVLLLWYTARFLAGPLFYVKLVLYLPSFYILVFLRGVNNAVHFTTENTYRIVSFIFYLSVIALIQVIIFKIRKKRRLKSRTEKGDKQ